MNSKLKAVQMNQSLEQDIQQLYFQTKAKVGEQDLEHIRHVAAYSHAIKKRSQELIQHADSVQSWYRGIILGALHTLLEFSELGHNILHGSYDHLDEVGEFHSSCWKWDFVTDPSEWKTMHHQNHHPFTNIVGKDHDLGYTILRMMPGQNWYLHNVMQPLVFASLLLSPSYYFTLFSAVSAAHTQGQKIFRKATFEKSLGLIKDHILESYIQPSLNLPFNKILPTLTGNYLVTVLGYAYTLHVLLLEHHADNTVVYQDDREESKDDYYRRQILTTTNFKPNQVLDAYLKKILDEEVKFANPPDFEVFYGGLDTHLEHHLFPDLPCNRQREVREQVKAICARHGLTYNIIEFKQALSYIYKNVFKLGLPFAEVNASKGIKLFKKSKTVWQRIKNGVLYQNVKSYYHGQLTRDLLGSAQKVKIINKHISPCGSISYLEIARTADWEQAYYTAGAYVSLGWNIQNRMTVRQYSLVDENDTSFIIAIKKQPHGVFSNFVAANVHVGMELYLFHTPKNSEGFELNLAAEKILFLAGGIGITPIMNMLLNMAAIQSKAEIHLIYFNRDDGHIAFKEQIQRLTRQLNLKVDFLCSTIKHASAAVSQGRLNPDIFKTLNIDLSEREIYICAPTGFIDTAKTILNEQGVSPEQIHTENFNGLVEKFQDDGKQHRIKFAKSGIEISVAGDVTLLAAAEQAGLNVPSGCKKGLCKACVCKKIEGTTQVELQTQMPFSSITLCNSVARSDHMVLDL